ncbi:hypothetical protein [Sulfurimonas sp. NWX79]|uniref:type IV toxin-antitoxin system AbiEi family antitoxin domain-containing protein n=1 Tax=Sulfurimonas sp. NWX79 TaxID=2925412 RepID=UPI003204624C
MNTIQLQKNIPTTVFTHDQLYSVLESQVNNVNAKISYLTKKGDLIRLKQGIYIFGDDYRQSPVNLISAANMLYAPSYVSFDYALSYYGLIPERVYEITSATLRANKLYETPIGRFSYKSIPLRAYSLGIDWLYDQENGGQFIATPEKALCDKIRYDRGIGRLSIEKAINYLEDDLRIEFNMLITLDAKLIDTIADAYRSNILHTVAKVISKGKRSA